MTKLSPYYSVGAEYLQQNITVNTTYGPQTYSLDLIEAFNVDRLQQGVIFGVCIGAASSVILLMLMLSSNRRSPVFILNVAALFLLIIHSGFSLHYYFGPFDSNVSYLTLSYGNVTLNDVNMSVATNWSQVFLIAIIEVNLAFQTLIVMQSRETVKYIFTGLIFTLVSLPTIVLWCYYGVITSISTIDPYRFQLVQDNLWVSKGTTPIFAASVVVYSMIFSGKLLLALKRRRDLGLKQFDALQVIFIMSAQSMIIPAIFTILTFAVSSSHTRGFTTFVPFVVVVSLPLSAMWASFQMTAPAIVSRNFVPTGVDYDQVPLTSSSTSTAVNSSKALRSTSTLINFRARKGEHEHETRVNSLSSATSRDSDNRSFFGMFAEK